ncbi:MAG TPA: tetratricopeptide repeat protein [Nitrosospira sp.]|nr:tetratricopeptide repeat protein [Nitrosospira sp.]
MKTRDFRRASACVVAAALLLLTSPVFADESDEVAKLYQQGDLTKALERANAYLAHKPNDPQMRFQKGLLLTEQEKKAEAIKVFSSLSKDYPDLPEPYNNLAVLYASQGQYEKAREALEAAIRTHPSYSTAHENLGDIYAKLASQAYGKALQLDNGNAAAQTKLAMIKDLFTSKPGTTQTTYPPNSRSQNRSTASATTAPAKPAAAATAPVTTAPAASASLAVTEKTVPKIEEKAEEKAEKGEKSAREKMQMTEISAPAKKSSARDESEEIINTVKAWAQAWSNKDAATYFDFYSSDFKAPSGVTRAAWEKIRQERISKPKSIDVAITNPKVSFTDPTHAKVSFKQSYHSGVFRNHAKKTLDMVKKGEKWLIQQERVGR